jgi:plastocyanin
MKRSMLAALALSMGFCTSAFAQVTGTVKFDGPAPERAKLAAAMNDPNCKPLHKEPPLDERVVVGKGGELANAVVYLKGDLKGEVPADEVLLDQVNCIYTPHVVSAMVGQKVIAQNSDAFLHNVNVQSEISPKNVAQPVKGQRDPIATKGAEYFKVVCNVHPWMSAWVAVFDHPFHSVTIDDGTFEIPTKGLADGEYEIAVWHERFKDNCATGKVTVKGGKGTIDLVVKPKAAAAQDTERTVTVSTGVAKPTCCTDGSKCAETAAKKAAEEKAKAAAQIQASAK